MAKKVTAHGEAADSRPEKRRRRRRSEPRWDRKGVNIMEFCKAFNAKTSGEGPGRA